MGNCELAAIYYKKTIYLVPHNVYAWLALADSYSELNDYNSAEEYLERGMDANPESLELMIGAAKIYAKFGKEEMVDDCFQRFVELQIDDVYCWIDFAMAYLQMDDYEKVEEVMDTAMQYAEDTNEMMPYVAVSRYKSGKRQEAYDMLRMYMGIGEHFSAKLIENMCPEMMEDNVIQEIIDSCGDKIK
jgi:tetratricopeptide (TPR) repeat protein